MPTEVCGLGGRSGTSRLSRSLGKLPVAFVSWSSAGEDAMRYRGRTWMPLLTVLAMLAAACAVEDSADQSDDQPPDAAEEQEASELFVFTEQECAEEILGFGDHLDEMGAILARLGASLDEGQLSQADSDHGHLSGQVIVALDLHESWSDYCDHLLPDRVTEVAALSEKVRQLWDQAEQECRDHRSDLLSCSR